MNTQTDTPPSVGELLGSLARETGSLIHQEVTFVRTEMSGKAKIAASNSGSVLLGGALAHAGLLALISALVLGLGSLVPLWLSALVIGVVLAGAGLTVARAGMSGLKKLDAVPSQSLDTIKDVASPIDGHHAPDEPWTKEKRNE